MIDASYNNVGLRFQELRLCWESYLQQGSLKEFVDFTVATNCLTDHLNLLRLPGLIRLSEVLEITAISYLDSHSVHPISNEDQSDINRQLDSLAETIASIYPKVAENRLKQKGAAIPTNRLIEQAVDQPTQQSNIPQELSETSLDYYYENWIKPRSVWIIATPNQQKLANAINQQLGFFGFKTLQKNWNEVTHYQGEPLAIIFIPKDLSVSTSEHFSSISRVRTNCPASQLIYLSKQEHIEPMVTLIRAGVDITLTSENLINEVLNYLLDLIKINEKKTSRVLIVEDSRTAIAVITSSLEERDINTLAITDPGDLLEVLKSYQPDLILMDMNMPRFNGVEATRVLRQIARYKTIPIVYLSGDSEIRMQVEALRLGGDQFLIKPVNPVLLAAIVQNKIERFNETQRSSTVDGLTGLLNHAASKNQLNSILENIRLNKKGLITVSVIMIDIDHFKSVNDTYGHPAGDEVIRHMAWLLRGRLRSQDMIGRYGGEEFLIALPDVDSKEALIIIDRIREAFSKLPHLHDNGTLLASFSAGIATYNEGDTGHSLIGAADNALLEAKKQGRNRVELAINLKVEHS